MASAALLVLATLLAACGSGDETGDGIPHPPPSDGSPTTVAAPPPVTRPATPAPPGTLVEADPVDAPPGASAWRVVFHSRSAAGDDVAVTGLVIAPAGEVVPGEPPRPVVAWGHPTTGTADACAPSARGPAEVPIAEAAVAQGWTVVAPDFEGLGVEGPHPYLVGDSAGHTMLDAVRAATQLEGTGATAASPVLLWGFSQGGQAALFAAELAPTYAPELDVRGVAAVAPVADPRAFWDRAAARDDQVGVAVTIAYGMAAAHPDLDPAEVLTAGALDDLDLLEQGCIGEVVAAFTRPVDEVVQPLDEQGAWAAVLAANQTGHRPSAAPVLLVQGTADDIVFPETTDVVANRTCRHGGPVAYERVEGAGHGDIPPERVLPWLQARLAGDPAPSTCP